MSINASRFLNATGKLPAILIIFLLICLNKLSFIPSGGEEQYLAYAKQYADPSWIPGSFTLTEFPGTRLIFQVIWGFFLKHFDFETVVFFSRAFNFLLISIPLAKIFRLLKISNAEIIIIMQLYLISDQSFFGGEWILRSFEAKTIAYVFILSGLYFILIRKYLIALIFIIAATYFHILVGGWFFLIALIYLIFTKYPLKQISVFSGTYFILTLPFVVYLYQGVFAGNNSGADDFDPDQIFCYFRLKHHLGIFDTFQFFYHEHLWGVILTVLFFGITVWLLQKKELSQRLKMLLQLNMIISGIIFLFLLVALADKVFLDRSCSLFLKYFPFRKSAISFLLVFLFLPVVVKKHIENRAFYKPLLVALLVVVIFPLLAFQSVNNIKSMVYKKAGPDYTNLISYIRKNTQKEDVFVLLDVDYQQQYSFCRLAERECFVVYKFAPGGTEKLSEWYKRLRHTGLLRRYPDHINKIAKAYKVDYIISTKAMQYDRLHLVYSNKGFFVYRVKRASAEVSFKLADQVSELLS